MAKIDNNALMKIKKLMMDVDYKLIPPLENDKTNPYSPNGKTGVAIGLLKLIPGESLKYISIAEKNENKEAPFLYFVGKFINSLFHPLIKQNDIYDNWIEFGPPPGGVFTLAYTKSPLSLTKQLERNNIDLKERKIRLTGDIKGKKLFVKAISPDMIEYCIAGNIDEISNQESANHQKIKFE